ncbi:DeoR/GlpR family DNA-binding transcription regulator [Heyndrickxia ginsengihumi]|uniref:DeoR/GlpR transcriptional regulator n=1 Tax=Heyndrickxia ginsengihumi TaxID=363870 RepID=A0A0A6VGD3_9BACI|nr:DeoR/GlpR family DNA-binding transcription regulator [Heyndrickxia ginsengihumi]KHD86641.1 hypothetical protein NG54_02150 [Heyndrickxia ginsengihumi]MBE6185196.1 DeoR/GlpR transcriptional regulator [Bacillus sp. (in: firmicutes)]MCM3022684.1 DeoR/GlpR family DNA-binding transcription regulator [Heyndrickxia ginsengihumi]NEY18978.1 DeoR/GlpR transcriptional regulator [Heyndrickxia ginsengihumi]
MSQKIRLKQIQELLNTQGEVSLEEIMSRFHVSRDTARRDLVKLEETGSVIRVKGGALRSSNHDQLTKYLHREVTKEKELIAKKACTFIHDNGFIMFDTSTTVECVARYMNAKGTTIVTNSIDIMNLLSERPETTVYLAGGKFNPFQRNFVGPQTAAALKAYKPDQLFIGACAIGLEGLSSPDEQEAFTKKRMIQSARKVILLADHTKFHKEFFHKVCDLSEIDVIITDIAPQPALKELLEKHSIELIITTNEEESERYGEN